ncbi:MAG: cytochrome c [Verrucomicrobiota bacterium]
MRYFLIIFGVAVLVVMGVAGKRGDLSRNRPLQIFADMKRQLKLRPQTANGFFPDGLSSQLPPAGTVAQSKPMIVVGQEIYPYEDAPMNTGRVTGTTNFVELNPLPVTAELLARGRERFTIFCLPCHGAQADGNGIAKKIGAMSVVANLHDKRIVELPDGELFNTISHGKNLMGAYGPQIPVEDRWAIVAYVRALQLSRLGSVDDLPAEMKAKLK